MYVERDAGLFHCKRRGHLLRWSEVRARRGHALLPMPTGTSNTSLQPSAVDGALANQILNLLSVPVLVLQADGRVVTANHAAAELLGRDAASLPGSSVIRCSAPAHAQPDAQLLQNALRTGQPQTRASQWLRDDQQEMPVSLQATPLGSPVEPLVLLQVRNLSEQHKLESDLRQSQKMESIGRLAGGIAHDFNNALTTILGLTESMINGRTAPNAESLREIRHAAQHAADLTSQMLAFSRRTILQMRNIQLEKVVEIGRAHV